MTKAVGDGHHHGDEPLRSNCARPRRPVCHLGLHREQSGLDRADYVITELHEAMQKLAKMPGLGHLRDDLADGSLRAWPVFSFLVIYRPDTSPCESCAFCTVPVT